MRLQVLLMVFEAELVRGRDRHDVLDRVPLQIRDVGRHPGIPEVHEFQERVQAPVPIAPPHPVPRYRNADDDDDGGDQARVQSHATTRCAIARSHDRHGRPGRQRPPARTLLPGGVAAWEVQDRGVPPRRIDDDVEAVPRRRRRGEQAPVADPVDLAGDLERVVRRLHDVHQVLVEGLDDVEVRLDRVELAQWAAQDHHLHQLDDEFVVVDRSVRLRFLVVQRSLQLVLGDDAVVQVAIRAHADRPVRPDDAAITPHVEDAHVDSGAGHHIVGVRTRSSLDGTTSAKPDANTSELRRDCRNAVVCGTLAAAASNRSSKRNNRMRTPLSTSHFSRSAFRSGSPSSSPSVLPSSPDALHVQRFAVGAALAPSSVPSTIAITIVRANSASQVVGASALCKPLDACTSQQWGTRGAWTSVVQGP